MLLKIDENGIVRTIQPECKEETNEIMKKPGLIKKICNAIEKTVKEEKDNDFGRVDSPYVC